MHIDVSVARAPRRGSRRHSQQGPIVDDSEAPQNYVLADAAGNPDGPHRLAGRGGQVSYSTVDAVESRRSTSSTTGPTSAMSAASDASTADRPTNSFTVPGSTTRR